VIWICFRIHGKPFTCLQAIWPDGAKSRPYRHPVSLDYHVVHQAGNVYWAAAADGMLRLRLAGTGAHSRIVLDKRYPRVIAQGRIRWMGIGPDGGLWMATVGGRSGLYRMDIPPVAAGEKAEVAYHPPSKSKPLHKGPPRKTVTKVRVATRNWFGYAYVKNGDLTRAGKLADQTVKFEFSDPKRPDRLQLADLMAGKYDLAVVRLPSQGGEDVNKLIRSLRDKKYSVTPIGWHVLGITVHPGCPLDAIDADTLRKVLRGRIQSWRDLTGKNEKINLVHNIEIQDILTAIASCTPAGHVERHFAIPKTLKELAADPTKMGMMAVEERLVSSGLKILPVRTAAGKPAVAPSVQNVKDGKYPFYACVAVIVRPDAPQAAKDFADVLRSPRFTSTFCGAWLTGLHYALPAAAKPQVFPANGADPPASMTGAVAVLPTENHSPHFLMARPEHLVGWDQAVADAVAGNKRLAIVDRAELKKVLRELKLAMATGSRRRGPMLSADVLVTSNMVTRNARAWLVIQAFHVRTGTCLGEVRLPVDPVHPERFTPALPDVLKKWWPGVLAGLQAARTRPILAVTVASVGKTVDQAVGPLRTELEATLAKDERVFVAQRRMMPEARRETLMRLMGLARSTGHGLPPAADFLVDVVKSGEEFRIRVMNGRSMKVLASTAMSAARASDWLRERVGALKKPAPPDDTGARPAGDAAKRQAKAELARGLKLEAKYKKLWAVGTTRGSGNSASEHRKQLAALRATMLQCFERAAQLDPTDELACRKVADIYWSRTNGAYDGMKKALARCTQHVDSFPRSRHIRGMMERVISLHGNLARYLETHPVRDASLTGVPRTLPEKKLIKEYHRGALKCLARYVKRFIAVRDKRDRSSWLSFGAVAKYYGLQMGRYFQLDISEQEMEEVVAEYGRAVGSRFDVMVPPEYRKLQYYTVKADKKSYVEQVAMMQKRWPDPNGTYWKLAKDGVLRGLCELYKTDARATHFYRWLRGWGKPGNLP